MDDKGKVSNKKKITLYISGVATLGAIATTTFLGLNVTHNKKNVDSRINMLHKIINGNSPAVQNFATMMRASGGSLVNQKRLAKETFVKDIAIVKANLKTGYIKRFKQTLTKWLATNKASLKTLGFDANINVVLSWFDFSASTITREQTTSIWNYIDTTSKQVEPYSMHDIKIPLKNSSGPWSFKAISYLDSKNVDLDKAIEFQVNEKKFIGQKGATGKTIVADPLFKVVHESALASNQSKFNAAVMELAKNLALRVITKQVNIINELSTLRIHYSKMEQIADIQKINVDLLKYGNGLKLDNQGTLIKDSVGKYVLATPHTSTIVSAIKSAFASYGMDYFAKWVAPTTGNDDGDYEDINGKQAYLIDISAKLNANIVNVLDYQYEINAELGNVKTQSWTKDSDIKFYILRSDGEDKDDVLRTLLTKYAQITTISQSRSNKNNLVAMINKIKDLMTENEIKSLLGKDKLWFDLATTGDPSFDGTNKHHKINTNTDVNALANSILKLDTSQISNIFGIKYVSKTKTKATTSSAYVNGSFKLQEDPVSLVTQSVFTIAIGEGSSAEHIVFKINRKTVELMEMLGVISHSLTKTIIYDTTKSTSKLEDVIRTTIMAEWATWKSANSFNLTSKLPLVKANITFENLRRIDVKTFIIDVYYKTATKKVLISKNTIISTK